MAIIYKVTIEETNKENYFHIKWLNLDTNEEDSFEQSAAEMMVDEMGYPWHQSRYQLEIGKKLFRFLDGDSGHLQKALKKAGHQAESLQLQLCTCKQTADWPFELLAREDTFLLPHRLHLVRYVSDWGKEKKSPHRIAH